MFIDDNCVGCGVCVESCPVEAISLLDNKATINKELCIECGSCIDVCPLEAIREEDRTSDTNTDQERRVSIDSTGSNLVNTNFTTYDPELSWPFLQYYYFFIFFIILLCLLQLDLG